VNRRILAAVVAMCALGIVVGGLLGQPLVLTPCAVGLIAGYAHLVRTQPRWQCQHCTASGTASTEHAARSAAQTHAITAHPRPRQGEHR